MIAFPLLMAFIGVPLHARGGLGCASQRSTCEAPGGAARRLRSPAAAAPAALRMAASAEGLSWPPLDGTDLRIGIVSSRWHASHVDAMVADVESTLGELGVQKDGVVKMAVPGSFELPMAARLMISSQKVDAVVVVGVIIKGGTDHYHYIADASSKALMQLQIQLLIPVVFGLLTCDSEAQVAERASGAIKEAPDWARTAVEMGRLRKSQMGGVTAGKKSVGFA